MSALAGWAAAAGLVGSYFSGRSAQKQLDKEIAYLRELNAPKLAAQKAALGWITGELGRDDALARAEHLNNQGLIQRATQDAVTAAQAAAAREGHGRSSGDVLRATEAGTRMENQENLDYAKSMRERKQKLLGMLSEVAGDPTALGAKIGELMGQQGNADLLSDATQAATFYLNRLYGQKAGAGQSTASPVIDASGAGSGTATRTSLLDTEPTSSPDLFVNPAGYTAEAASPGAPGSERAADVLYQRKRRAWASLLSAPSPTQGRSEGQVRSYLGGY